MPLIDGLQLLKCIRENGFDIPAIVMSGNAHTYQEDVSKLDVQYLLPKPFPLALLTNKIEDIFQVCPV
jgi:CheY-like chemotaxis protein